MQGVGYLQLLRLIMQLVQAVKKHMNMHLVELRADTVSRIENVYAVSFPSELESRCVP